MITWIVSRGAKPQRSGLAAVCPVSMKDATTMAAPITLNVVPILSRRPIVIAMRTNPQRRSVSTTLLIECIAIICSEGSSMPAMSSAMRAASKAYCPASNAAAVIAASWVIRRIGESETSTVRPNMAIKVAMPAAWNNAMKLALRKITDSVSGRTLALLLRRLIHLHGHHLEVQLPGHDVVVIRARNAPSQRVAAGAELGHRDADLLACSRRCSQSLFRLLIFLDGHRSEAGGFREG